MPFIPKVVFRKTRRKKLGELIKPDYPAKWQLKWWW